MKLLNETGTAGADASANEWMNINNGTRYVAADINTTYSFDFSPRQ